jgi:hypothetical protein
VIENSTAETPDLRIRVLWKNVLSTIALSSYVLLDLSLFSVSHIHAIQYTALGVGLVVSLFYTVRAARVSIVLQGCEIELRRLAPTKRFMVSDLNSIVVGDEVTPIKRYYLVFSLNDGRIIKMKPVFLWGVTKNSRDRVEGWATALNERIEGNG